MALIRGYIVTLTDIQYTVLLWCVLIWSLKKVFLSTYPKMLSAATKPFDDSI